MNNEPKNMKRSLIYLRIRWLKFEQVRVSFPGFILREQFGNNSGTDMLAQYGDFGTK
jgi:hypothetical protein